MIFLPGLTSTKKDRIPAFLEELLRLKIDSIALFPTCLGSDERTGLYQELERVPKMRTPLVHLRSDCAEGEVEYLVERFGAEVFNIHPRGSTHPFGSIPPRWARRFFVENVDVPPEAEELVGLGGLCPDFSHLESARLFGDSAYVERMDALLARFAVGVCHVSAVRVGDPNRWSGGWDHHDYRRLSDFDYLEKYRDSLPATWAAMELENSLSEQLDAIAYITASLDQRYGKSPGRPDDRRR